MKRLWDALLLVSILLAVMVALGSPMAEARQAREGEVRDRRELRQLSGSDTEGPSLAVYPEQTVPLRFSHVNHLTLGLSCLSCHEGGATSVRASDRLLPSPKLCDGCHGSDHSTTSAALEGPSEQRASCGFCHVGHEEGANVQPLVLPAPNLHFSHKAHFDKNIGCAQCHAGVEEVDLATRSHLPRMRDCMRCHEMEGPAKGGAEGECRTCHLTEADGRLRVQLPSGVLMPLSSMERVAHTADFIHRHQAAAADDAKLCSSCHREEFCVDCHDGRVRPRSFHPNDWLSMHSVAATQDSPRCTSCHNSQTFCLSCHQRAGVVMSGPNQGTRQAHLFHPPGFAERGRGPGHHAWEAMRNLNACVSCHTERDCAVCHAASGRGGMGVNLHGPGFLSRCKSALRRNARPCLVCHEPTSQELALCR